MDFKEIPVGSRQDNIEPGLEKVFISVKGGNMDIYDMTGNVIVHVIEHDNREVYLAEKDEKGKIITRTAGKYRYAKPSPKLVLCDLCHKPTIFVTDGEKCVLCRSWVCHDCVDWKCMVETGTDQIVCKECSKLFENCKGDN